MVNHPLILASQSPRREQILSMVGIPFDIIPSDVDEAPYDDLPPIKMVETLSLLKADAVADKHPNAIVLGSDTVVSLDQRVFGKPHTETNAKQMLRELSGKRHQVLTGVSLVQRSTTLEHTFYQLTEVTVSELTDDEIKWYVTNYKPLDKAGSYGIQDGFGKFITGIEGCYFNVVGLPLSKVYKELYALYPQLWSKT
jgi:septum formation protein